MLLLQTLLLPLAAGVDERCNTTPEYVKDNYEMCCGRGAYLNRRKICLENTSEQDEEERTPSYPKVKNKASTSCTACSKLVENFKDSLLPRLAARQKIIRKSHSRSKLAASGTVGTAARPPARLRPGLTSVRV